MIHKLVKIVFGVNLLTNQIKSGLEWHNFSLIEGHMDYGSSNAMVQLF